MGIIKLYFFFYLSYWSCLLLIVYGNFESNPGPGSDKRIRVLYSNIQGLHANLEESWLWLDRIMMFWFVMSLKSLYPSVTIGGTVLKESDDLVIGRHI